MNQELINPGETVVQKDPNGMWAVVISNGRQITRTKTPQGQIYEQETNVNMNANQANTASPTSNVFMKTTQAVSFVSVIASLVVMVKNIFRKS